jgi:hypothetical protein
VDNGLSGAEFSPGQDAREFVERTGCTIMIGFDDLRYIILPREPLARESALLFEVAFRFWREAWTETFREDLKVEHPVFSDDFSRQSRIGCLFFDERCVALTFFHFVDFRLSTARLDSYFDVWPDEAISKLRKDGDNIVVGSNITIDRAFRGKDKLAGGLSVKSLLVDLAVATFLESRADAMTGTMRCNRGMHDLARAFGATQLVSGVLKHGVEVELMAFYRRELLERRVPGEIPAVEKLWECRTDHAGPWEIQKPR